MALAESQKRNSSISALPRFASFVAAAALTVGCGYSEEEWQAQLDKYGKLSSEYQSEKDERSKAEASLAAERARVAELKKKLSEMGVSLDSLSTQLQEGSLEKDRLSKNMQELQAALEEYKKRADQLEKVRARYDELKTKLQGLVRQGLKVEIRHNRMVIRLPGDVLFASGSDKLTKDGEKVILQVAEVIRKDEQLRTRYFQIAGHTDDKPLKGGKFGDNWGLSAMRAREVLTFLVEPTADGGGGLDRLRLHAAGYGETDPVAKNDSDDGRKQNRRVELVIMPDVGEMLNLEKMM